MFLEWLQRGVRTAYRALGAREVTHPSAHGEVHGFVFDGGHDATLVLVHGLGDSSTTWYRVISSLRSSANIVALDLPPNGLSRLDDRPFLSPGEQALEVLPILKKYVNGNTTVVGQSMGGWVAQWILHHAPDLADRAVLISPAGAGTLGSLDAIPLMTPHTTHEVLDLWDRQWYHRPAAAEFMARDVLPRFHSPEVRGFLLSLRTDDVLEDEQLRAIETPLLVMWGMQDGILDMDTPKYLAERWGAPVERTYLARCGHLPHIERGEAVVDRMRDYVGGR